MVYVKKASKRTARRHRRRFGYRKRAVRIPRPETFKWNPAEITHTGLAVGTSALTMVPAMSQGDDVGYRAGREVFLRRLLINMYIRYQLPESATYDCTCRFIVFQSRSNTLSHTDFDSSTVLDTLNFKYNKNVGRVLSRGTFPLGPSTKQIWYKTKNIKVNRKIKWQSSTYTDMINPIYIVFITDAVNDANNKIDVKWQYTAFYNDM